MTLASLPEIEAADYQLTDIGFLTSSLKKCSFYN